MRQLRRLKKTAAAGICACAVLSAQGAGVLAAAGTETETAKSGMPDSFLPESSSRYLEEEELAGWTRKELEYGRYEIFARHGMLFDDPEAAEYFSGMSWYFGFIKESDFPESMLNEYETANAELLKKLAAEAEDDTEETETETDSTAGAGKAKTDAGSDAEETETGAAQPDAEQSEPETGKADAEETDETETEPETESETETEPEIHYVPGEYTAYADGYASKIMVVCTFDEDGIVNMGMNLSGETAGQGAEIGNDLIKSILKEQTSDVDAVSGATVTSDAVKEAVAACIEQAKVVEESGTEPESEQQTESGTEAETEAATEPETVTETQPETAAETEAETQPETAAETEAETQPETAAETETETQPETAAETETETQPETAAETEAETQSETAAETETETQPETEPETEAQQQLDFSKNEDLKDVDIMAEIEKMEAQEGGGQPGEEAQRETEAQLSETESVDTERSIEYIFPDIAERYLDRSEVSRLSPQAVSYAKNELYARHGRKFASQELKDYFGTKSWYVGTVDPDDFTDKVFNAYEQANLLLIVEYDTYKLDQPGYDIHRVNEELSLFAAETTEATIAPESNYLSGQYIFGDSDMRCLTEEEVNVLSARVACYARYEIYARRGAIFTPLELQEYFGSKNWYAGRMNLSDFTSEMFNQYELYNMKLLNEREKSLVPEGYLSR